jgi:hypothetical protein
MQNRMKPLATDASVKSIKESFIEKEDLENLTKDLVKKTDIENLPTLETIKNEMSTFATATADGIKESLIS